MKNTNNIATLQDLENELWARTQRENLVWKTQQGNIIPIKEMSDRHLQNTINLLRRNMESDIWDHIGDMDPLDYYD